MKELSGSADAQPGDGGVSPRSADEVIASLFAGDVETGSSICMKLRAAMVRSCSMTGLRRCSSQAILLRPVTAPYASAVVQLLVPFTDDDLEGTERTVSDVAVVAVRRLSDVGLNVVSVSTASAVTSLRPRR